MSPSSDTRERIVASARELIYTRSYADVGVAQICDAADVKKGSFYHFFPSKRELTLAVLDETYADAKTRMLDRAFDPQLPPLQRLHRFVELNAQIQAELFAETGVVPGCQFGNLAAEQATQDAVLRARVGVMLDRLQAEIRVALGDALAAGEVAAIDVDATAAAMLAYFEGVLLIAKSHNDPGVVARLLPALPDIRIAPAAAAG
ncbi:MAG: TetR/AcrR family transcriptional regulator [Gammaproteobacteria bacterium]|nr:TetR/AcrR family transcriptional regulator [Gammaproteobacteria bacterium]